MPPALAPLLASRAPPQPQPAPAQGRFLPAAHMAAAVTPALPAAANPRYAYQAALQAACGAVEPSPYEAAARTAALVRHQAALQVAAQEGGAWPPQIAHHQQWAPQPQQHAPGGEPLAPERHEQQW